MRLPIRITAIGVLLLFLGPMDVYGVDRESEDVHDPIQKGTKELALLAGFGMAHELWNGVADTRFLTLGVHIGRVLSSPRGPGFLRGNLEISGEILPLYLVDQGETTAGFSATFLARHFLAAGSRWRPFISIGFGGLYTADPVPPDSSRFNFTPQIGLGLSYAHNKRFVFYAEYRLLHYSNGSISDENPGINCSYLQFGMSLYRW